MDQAIAIPTGRATLCVPVDIDAAIVRHVGQQQQAVSFTELAELFADAPAHGAVTSSCLDALWARLEALCTAGRLARKREPRQRRRGITRRRAQFVVPMGAEVRGADTTTATEER